MIRGWISPHVHFINFSSKHHIFLMQAWLHMVCYKIKQSMNKKCLITSIRMYFQYCWWDYSNIVPVTTVPARMPCRPCYILPNRRALYWEGLYTPCVLEPADCDVYRTGILSCKRSSLLIHIDNFDCLIMRIFFQGNIWKLRRKKSNLGSKTIHLGRKIVEFFFISWGK